MAILAILIQGITRCEEPGSVGPLEGGYAIHKLPKGLFQGEVKERDEIFFDVFATAKYRIDGTGKMTPTKLLGLLLVIVYIVALKVLAVLDIHGVFEHRLLLPLLNTLFAGIVPIAVAYVAGKAYVKGGSATFFFMGCGMLSFGLCAILAGWLIRASDGANLNVTVYNAGAFGGSVFHAIGAILGTIGAGYSDDIRRRRRTVVLAYVGVTVFGICFSLAALRGLVPPFFIQGVGPTELRQAILGSSVLLYSVSSIFLMGHYVKGKSDFLYWYSLCLSMIAIGLFAFFVQKSVGCPVGWLGRSANYVGGIFALVAILGALRDARAKGVSLERTIANGFGGGEASYWRGLLPVLPIPIFLVLLVILVPTGPKDRLRAAGFVCCLEHPVPFALPFECGLFCNERLSPERPSYDVNAWQWYSHIGIRQCIVRLDVDLAKRWT